MFFAGPGGPLPSHFSANSFRKGDPASALLLRSEAGRSTSPAAWALRTGRRLRLLCLTALITIYIIYYLDLLPHSHDSAVVASPYIEVTLNTTRGEHSSQVTANSTAESELVIESAAAVDADRDAAIKQAAVEQGAMEKAAFIQDISTDIRGLYDGQSLYNLCSSKHIKWNPNIVLDCPPLEGGYGNVRNAALTCLRLAIETGGSLVMPQISQRNPKDIGDFRTKNMMPFGYLFDTAHFKSTLATYCPQLTIHDSLAELNKHPGISKDALTLTPFQLPNITRDGPLINNPSKLRRSFHAWLKAENKAKHSPIRVSLTNRIIWTWPTSHDPASLVRSFSSVIRLSHAVRLPAAEALYTLANSHIATTPSQLPSRRNNPPFTLPFIGIHLRAEKDATQYRLTNYTLQTNYYLSRLTTDLLPSLLSHPLSPNTTIPLYIASGDASQISRFAAQLSFVAPRVRVITKSSLLPASTLASLTWDQQALIDFQILERAAHVMGVRESSFAWTLALKRAAAANFVVGGFPAGPCWVDDDDEEGGDGEVEGQNGGINGTKKAVDVGEKAKGKGRRRRRRGCKEDLAPYEYWRDELSSLVGDLGEAANESVDVVRSAIWP